MTNLGEKYQLSAEDWLSKNKNHDNKQDPHAVFNVLDVMLKDSLERLKMMRSAIVSWYSWGDKVHNIV